MYGEQDTVIRNVNENSRFIDTDEPNEERKCVRWCNWMRNRPQVISDAPLGNTKFKESHIRAAFVFDDSAWSSEKKNRRRIRRRNFRKYPLRSRFSRIIYGYLRNERFPVLLKRNQPLILFSAPSGGVFIFSERRWGSSLSDFPGR